MSADDEPSRLIPMVAELRLWAAAGDAAAQEKLSWLDREYCEICGGPDHQCCTVCGGMNHQCLTQADLERVERAIADYRAGRGRTWAVINNHVSREISTMVDHSVNNLKERRKPRPVKTGASETKGSRNPDRRRHAQATSENGHPNHGKGPVPL